MITHIQNITGQNFTARIFKAAKSQDFEGNTMPPCYLVDFLDADGDEMLDVAWEYLTLKEAKEHIREVLEGLAVG